MAGSNGHKKAGGVAICRGREKASFRNGNLRNAADGMEGKVPCHFPGFGMPKYLEVVTGKKGLLAVIRALWQGKKKKCSRQPSPTFVDHFAHLIPFHFRS